MFVLYETPAGYAIFKVRVKHAFSDRPTKRILGTRATSKHKFLVLLNENFVFCDKSWDRIFNFLLMLNSRREFSFTTRVKWKFRKLPTLRLWLQAGGFNVFRLIVYPLHSKINTKM